jgi:hypothetical protein
LVAKPVSVKCLSSTEITGRRKDVKCFHYDYFFTDGHKQMCKQLFIIEVVNEEDEAE